VAQGKPDSGVPSLDVGGNQQELAVQLQTGYHGERKALRMRCIAVRGKKKNGRLECGVKCRMICRMTCRMSGCRVCLKTGVMMTQRRQQQQVKSQQSQSQTIVLPALMAGGGGMAGTGVTGAG
jgi:hypothetical protein